METPAPSPELRQFWQPDSLVSVMVASGGDEDEEAGVPDGCVYAIRAPLSAEEVAARRLRDQAEPLKQALRHLLGADDRQRSRWVARRQPSSAADRVDWWLHLMLLIKHHVATGRAPADWARLYLWAARHAGDTGAFTPAETAVRIAYFAAELRDGDLAGEVADVLPTADTIVRTCLRHIPVPLDGIPGATDLHRLDLETMRRSRQAMNLIDAAAPHLAHVRDPRLADQLTAWIAAAPRLV